MGSTGLPSRIRPRRPTSSHSFHGETLEPRTMLAVTADVMNGQLRIFLNKAGDKASLADTGLGYRVDGTGQRTSFSQTFSRVRVDSVSVIDSTNSLTLTRAGRQTFTIPRTSAEITVPVSVAASVEQTIVNKSLNAAAVSLASPYVTLAADVSANNALLEFPGRVTLAASVNLYGDGITFHQTVDGPHRLRTVNKEGFYQNPVLFKGAVGSVTPLAGMSINRTSEVVSTASIKLSGAAKNAAYHGIEISGDVRRVRLTGVGSSIRNFAGSGIALRTNYSWQGGAVSGFAISKNGVGISVSEGNYSDLRIAANTITLNKSAGILLDDGFSGPADSVTNLIIGGDEPAQGNLLRDNGSQDADIVVNSDNDFSGVVIRSNTIQTRFTGILARGGAVRNLRIVDNSITALPSAIPGNIGIALGSGDYNGTTIAGNGISGLDVGMFLPQLSDSSCFGLTIGGAAGGNHVHGCTYGLTAKAGSFNGTVISANTFEKNTVGVALSATRNLTLAGNHVSGNTAVGILVGALNATPDQSSGGQCSGSSITGNTFSGNKQGISLRGGQSLIISGNTVAKSSLSAFAADGVCTGTTVTGNTFQTSQVGVRLLTAANLTVNGGNKISSNSTGLLASGICNGTVVTGNTINGNTTNINVGPAAKSSGTFQA